MLLTEGEAKGKACCGPPAVWVVIAGVTKGIEAHTTCGASGCMAWRWADPALVYPATGEMVCRRFNAANVEENWPIEKRRGFCGLAGWAEVEA